VKELNVQKYLRSGKTLDDLKEEHGIKFSEKDDLVILNYDQLNSTKTDPIVMECRSLILKKGTWDIVSMAMRRFFNYGEAENVTEDFDFNKAVALQKIDGSIISVFHDGNGFRMSTRGMIDGGGEVGLCSISFKTLFDMTVKQYAPDTSAFFQNLDPDYNYIFELTAPENRVVTQYKERSLHLLTMRSIKEDWAEVSPDRVDLYAIRLGVKRPEAYSFSDIASLVQMAAELKDLDEGYVCVDYSKQIDGNYSRIKVKSPVYVAIAHLKESSSASMRALMQLVIAGEQDEFVGYFPEYKNYVDEISKKYSEYTDSIKADIDFSHNLDKSDRKAYADWAKHSVCPAILFQVLDGHVKSWQEYMDKMCNNKGPKIVAKNMLKILKIKDIEWGEGSA